MSGWDQTFVCYRVSKRRDASASRARPDVGPLELSLKGPPEESIAHLPDFGLRPLVIPPGLHGHSAAATWMDSRPSLVSSPEPSGTPNPGGL